MRLRNEQHGGGASKKKTRAYQNCISFDLSLATWFLLRPTIHNTSQPQSRLRAEKQQRCEHREQRRRAKSHGQGRLHNAIRRSTLLNISSPIWLLMVRVFFSCVISAHRIISGWLLFIILLALRALRSLVALSLMGFFFSLRFRPFFFLTIFLL